MNGIFAILAVFIGLGISVANGFLCESLFSEEHFLIFLLACMFIGLLGAAGMILVSPRSVSGTILQIAPSRSLFFRRATGLALLFVPTLLAAGSVPAYKIYHDYRHSKFRPDLDLYRHIAREDGGSYLPPPYLPHPLKAKALVLTERGWINDEVQHALGELGANQATEVATLIFLRYFHHKEERFVYVNPKMGKKADIVITGYDIRFVDKTNGKTMKTDRLEGKLPSVVPSTEISHNILNDPFQEQDRTPGTIPTTKTLHGIYKVRKPTPQEIANYLRTLQWEF